MKARVVHVFTVPDSLMFLRGQVAFMRERGFDLSVVTSPGPMLDAFVSRENVRGYGVPMARRITPAEDTQSLRHLVRLFRDLRPDIVHAHTPKGGLLGTAAATIARVRTRVYHMRGLPLVTARGLHRALLQGTELTSCTAATHVLCVGASLRREAVARGIVRPSKVKVLASGTGNGVDCTGRFDPDSPTPSPNALRERLGVGESPLVGFVGRLVRDKGVIELAEAWRRIRQTIPAAHLVIAGHFEERDKVPDDVRSRLADDPHVHMLGFVEDTVPLYAAVDVVAFPSHREGFPNVPLEAASMRVPVVAAAAIGTVDAVVDGVTGTLVPTGDVAALGAALERYLTDRELRLRHGHAARERVLREFRREHVWDSLAEFYDAALSNQGKR